MIDLYSDTLTRPTPDMRRFMCEAEVGDEQKGEDPTVNLLQQMVADLLGKEAASVPPLRHHVQRDRGQGAHAAGRRGAGRPHLAPIHFEGGGARPALGRADGLARRRARGLHRRPRCAPATHPRSRYMPPTRLVSVENTSNLGGGRVWSLAQVEDVSRAARGLGLATHMDGARLLNAVVASGTPARAYAALVDSLWIDFSKGLGAPVGACLAGSRAFIEEAWRYKQALGGAMRQAGIIAAGGVYALRHHVSRLAEDHDNAKAFARGIAGLRGIALDPAHVETNIVIFDVARHRPHRPGPGRPAAGHPRERAVQRDGREPPARGHAPRRLAQADRHRGRGHGGRHRLTDAGGAFSVRGMTAAAISPAQLAILLEQPSPHALLDVRERAAFERGHIYRATPLPRRLIELRLPALVTAPGTLIVLYDDDGSLSALAAATLAEMGYTEVFVLAGGLEAWRAARPPGGPGPQRAEQGLRRARAARLQDARGHLPRALRPDGGGPRHGHRGHAHARGVLARLPARRVEHARRRAGAPHRRAGGEPRADHRRALRRADPLLPGRRVAAPHGAAQPDRGGEERHDGLAARRPRARARRDAAGRPRRPTRSRRARGRDRHPRGRGGRHPARLRGRGRRALEPARARERDDVRRADPGGVRRRARARLELGAGRPGGAGHRRQRGGARGLAGPDLRRLRPLDHDRGLAQAHGLPARGGAGGRRAGVGSARAARSRPASRPSRRSASTRPAVWSSRCRPGRSGTRWC